MTTTRTHPTILSILLLLVVGCDETKPAAPPTPWTWSDADSGIRLSLEPEWERIEPTLINESAIFAVRAQEDRFALHILRVELPGGEALAHDLAQLKAQNLAQLSSSLGGYELERQGAITLGGRPGTSAFVKGDVGDETFRYVLAYTIHRGSLFQVVATSRHEDRQKLASLVDGVLATWTFESDPVDGTP